MTDIVVRVVLTLVVFLFTDDSANVYFAHRNSPYFCTVLPMTFTRDLDPNLAAVFILSLPWNDHPLGPYQSKNYGREKPGANT